MEEIEEELRTVLAHITPRPGTVPFYSTVTGEPIDTTTLDAGYWYRNLRGTVRFETATRALVAKGFRAFVEVSSHPVLVPGVEETAQASGVGPVVVTGTLRRDEDGPARFLEALARLHVQGVAVDWPALLGRDSGWPLDLPTYAFQRQRFWLESGWGGGDPAVLGLTGVDHPLLGAQADIPATGGVLFTSRWSLWSQPWLADHSAAGVTLVPGTAFVDLVVRAGDEVGCGVLAELVIEAPMAVPEQGGVQVRVTLGEADESGQRTVEVHSRAEDTGPETTWTRHVSGRLAADQPAADFELTQWPPVGAVPVEGAAERAYADMAETGYGYGAAFRGLSRVWTRGEEVFAELVLPEEAGKPDGFGVHPALLDACFHGGVFRDSDEERQLVMPFVWNDVRLFATGATALRVHLSYQGSDTVALRLADAAGAPVASVGSVVARPVGTEQLRSSSEVSGGRMFEVVWDRLSVRPVERGPGFVSVGSVGDVRALVGGVGVPEVLVLEVVGGGRVDASGVRELTGWVLEVVQAWLGEPELGGSRLLVVTRGAVGVGGEAPVDLAGAAVGGLLRSVQVENPGRVVLVDVDVDGGVVSGELLAAVVGLDEPQVAVRGGVCFARRLGRV
ncbi:acyltransferase domain-containing protein, partial [Streptomyces seoulensis]